jgi:deferrochelatase/peroxidase EfeB
MTARDAAGQPEIALDAHIRLAGPVSNGGERILRRGYSFTDGIVPETGTMDGGLRSARQAGALSDSCSNVPFGRAASLEEKWRKPGDEVWPSQVFACPPGLRPSQDWGGALLG